MTTILGKRLLQIQRKLHDRFGPMNWWPAETPFEVVIGAVLTQNTAWTNVEQAIHNLREAEALTPERLTHMPLEQLEELIKPAGFFRQKAVRLQNLARHLLEDWKNDLDDLCSGPLDAARSRLLALPGIGPETADSILLYATNRPSFVVDAYTRRILERLDLLKGREKYDEVRLMFMQHLQPDVQLFNEYHAQIVQLAKTHCRKSKPLCSDCPLVSICLHAKQSP